MFRLMLTRKRYTPELHTNPMRDPHAFVKTPRWPGTVVGIDLNIEQGVEFSELLEQIRKAYYIDVKHKKDFSKKIRFNP
jgi:hypothetical protein